MALINCPECGKEVSDMSIECIGCGYKFKKINPSNNSPKTLVSEGMITQYKSKTAKKINTIGNISLIILIVLALINGVPLLDDYTYHTGVWTIPLLISVSSIVSGIVIKYMMSGFAIIVEKCYRDMNV